MAEPLFLLTDTAVVGRLGTDALAALGIASVILTTIVSVSIFLAYGTTAAVARTSGAGDMARALRQGVDGCWLALVVGLLFLVVGLPLAGPAVSWFGPTEAVAELAVTYLRISLIGVPSMLLVLAGTGVLRGLLDTRTPLVVSGLGAIGNVLLNILLVHGVGWGIAGAAIGTVIAQTAMAAAFLRVVIRGARSHDASWRPDWSGVRAAFGAGVPLIVRTVTMRVVALAATAVVTSMGTAELAAHQVVYTTWSLLALVLDAVAIAAQALVGRALGAGDVHQVHSVTTRMVQWGVLVGTGLGVVVLAAGSIYAQIFTPDADVRALIVVALIVAAVVQPIAGWVFVLDGVLIGAGDAPYLAWASVISVATFTPVAVGVGMSGVDGRPGMVAIWGAIGVWMLARWVTLALRARGDAWIVTGSTR